MRLISERQARFWCLVLGAVAGIASAAAQLLAGQMQVATIGLGAGALLAVLAALYQRGWEPARLLAVGLFTLAVIGALPPDNALIGVVIASSFALLLAGAWWVLGIGALTAIGIVARGVGVGISLSWERLSEIPVMLLLVGLMALTRAVLDGERSRSQGLAAEAREAQARSEAQAAELARQAEALASQNEQQRRLLDLVAILETPAVTIADGVLLAPIVGQLDSNRAASLTSRLLALVSAQRVRLVVLDLAGVPAVDSAVAQSLLRTIQAVQLLGCEVMLSGIAAPVAATMAQLGVGFAGVKTWRSPQEALEALRVAAG